MTSADKEHNWIHRVTREIRRQEQSPGPDWERLRDPWENPRNQRPAAPPAKPYNPLRHGLEDR